MNGDVLTDLDLRALIGDHRASGALMTVAGTRQTLRLESGVLHLDPETGALVQYEEKPEVAFTVGMGVYVYEPEVLRHMPRRRPVDQPEVIQRLLDLGERVHCHQSECSWYDIGTRDGYRQAREHFAADPRAFLPADGS
jgi:NDP-sugar pyrophosphorylase family protein